MHFLIILQDSLQFQPALYQHFTGAMSGETFPDLLLEMIVQVPLQLVVDHLLETAAELLQLM